MKRKGIKQLVVLLVAVAALLGLSLGAVNVITALRTPRLHENSAPPASTFQPGSALEPGSTASVPPALSNIESSSPVSELPPSSSEETSIPPPPGDGRPARTALAQPKNGLVDMAYFDNATFIGDSITQGLQLYRQGIPNAHYCAYKSISPKGIYDGSVWPRPDGTREIPMDAIVASQPDNVYVLLGTNAIVAMDDTAFLAYYAEMLDAVKAAIHPEVSIYIQGITPVVQGVDTRFDMNRIHNLNDALANLAYEKGMHYINLDEVLAGEDGWLKPEYGAPDGYHLTPDGYAAWVEYLRTHTATHRRHAHLYLEGPDIPL